MIRSPFPVTTFDALSSLLIPFIFRLPLAYFSCPFQDSVRILFTCLGLHAILDIHLIRAPLVNGQPPLFPCVSLQGDCISLLLITDHSAIDLRDRVRSMIFQSKCCIEKREK